MPHIPRSMAPSGMIDPSTVPRAPVRQTTRTKPPVPYMGSSPGEIAPTERMRQGNQLVDKLSMKNWEVDPMKIIKQLSDKEVKSDEYSGMVS